MIFIDLTAYRCPVPLVRTKLTMKQMRPGEQLRVILSDHGSRKDVPNFLKKQGHGLEVIEDNQQVLELVVTKRQDAS